MLRGIALTVLGLAVCAAAPVQDADPRTFTLVHLSDVHMRPGFNAPERFRLALRDVRLRKPALIINTGDTVDGSAEADVKWAAWHAAVTAEISDIPLYNLLGNHDISALGSWLSALGVARAVIARSQPCGNLDAADGAESPEPRAVY